MPIRCARSRRDNKLCLNSNKQMLIDFPRMTRKRQWPSLGNGDMNRIPRRGHRVAKRLAKRVVSPMTRLAPFQPNGRGPIPKRRRPNPIVIAGKSFVEFAPACKVTDNQSTEMGSSSSKAVARTASAASLRKYPSRPSGALPSTAPPIGHQDVGPQSKAAATAPRIQPTTDEVGPTVHTRTQPSSSRTAGELVVLHTPRLCG